jgi:predicted membrane channel-forming protein YqfA (hemolysin III family)
VSYLIIFIAYTIKKRGRLSKYVNYLALKKGIIYIIPAFFFFARGLNEHEDYLRINHGLWHIFI